MFKKKVITLSRNHYENLSDIQSDLEQLIIELQEADLEKTDRRFMRDLKEAYGMIWRMFKRYNIEQKQKQGFDEETVWLT
ncbi:MAG: hypothetical protein B6244_10355 [Candidatus Cloacimonetes bacterium 4572_55]|nr:MAG: hypothetical protein B6244_10355 [Candidatus Cloacimonetes bacterium 4572_55]